MLLAAVVLTLTAGWVSFLGGIAIPFVTGLVTKYGASSPGLKGVLTVVLTVALTIATAIVQGDGIVESTTLIQGAVTLVVSTLWLYQIHLPLNLDQYLIPSKGIGGSSPEIGGI